MQMKIMMRYNLALVRTASITKTFDGAAPVKWEHSDTLLVELIVQPLWKNWKFLIQLEINLPHDLPVPLLGTHVKEIKSECQRHLQ